MPKNNMYLNILNPTLSSKIELEMKRINLLSSGVFLGLVLAISSHTNAQTYILNAASHNTTVNTCAGTFYDSGGAAGNYANSENRTITFCAPVGQQIQFTFSQWCLENSYDFLYVHNGPTTGSAQVAGSPFSGGGPAVITSTGNCLTFRFTSDGSVVQCGWTAAISCFTPGTCTDGIQNQNETGVDCGGVCAPCHCSDGIQNFGEDGVDCGTVCGIPCPCEVTVAANPGLNLPCGGGTVVLTAAGQGSTLYAMDNNFDGGNPGSGWSASPGSTMFTNPCGPSIDGGSYMWMGSATNAPRTLQTAPLDLSCGAEVCFYLRFSLQCGSGNCEGPDQPNEGVALQFSTNGGTTWTLLGYFNPYTGVVEPTISTATNPYLSCNQVTNFTTWNQYCFTIPAAGLTANTVLRWFQPGASGTCCDHWGIDNVTIATVDCNGYHYNWDHLAPWVDDSVQTVTVNTTTSYTVWYTNGTTDSCFTDVTVNVGSLNPLVVSGTAEICLGANDGTISIGAASGGTAPYTYALSGAGTFSQVNNGNFTGLAPGTYAITVTDAAGCQAFSTFTVNAGISCCNMTNTQAFTNVTCFGANNGTITLTQTGGAGTVNFSINGGTTTQTNGNFTGLSQGTYNIVITDANGCVYNAVINIVQPAALTITPTLTHTTCGNSNGAINLVAGGGSGAGYQYSINGGTTFQASGNFTGLAAGNYNVVIQDGTGCQQTQVVTINNAGAPVINSVTPTNPLCDGQCNGSIVVAASGGVGALQYSINNGATFQAGGTFNSQCAGTYDIMVQDANGCPVFSSVTLTAPAAIAFTPTVTDLLCNGVCAGIIGVTGVTGGNGAYQYSNNNGATFQAGNSFNLLCAGTYNMLVQDGNGCQGTLNAIVAEPPALSATTVVSQPTCNNVCDGVIDVSAFGGTAPIQYSSDNGVTYQASPTFNGLCSGTFTITVDDANGCKVTEVINLNNPAAITLTFATVDPACGAANGEINITSGGGTGALQYSINGGTTFQATGNFTGLNSGTFNLVVQDANGCQITDLATLNNLAAPTVDAVAFTDPLCPGACDGTITITASGGVAPLEYSINGGTTFQASNVFNGVCAGNYNIQVSDANGCIATGTATLSNPAAITFNSAVVNLLCNAVCIGEITIINPAGGAGGYSYSNNNGATFQASDNFNGLCAGTYTMAVQDANGCVVTAPVNVFEPSAVTITHTTVVNSCNQANGPCDGQINITGAGGTGAITYSMDNGTTFQAGASFSGVCAGTYNIIVQDANGCQATETATVSEPVALSFTSVTLPTSCGTSNGEMTITPAGGSGVYEYSNNNGVSYQASNLFVGLGAGAYNVCIRDNNGCVFCQVVNLNNDPAQTIDNIAIVHNTCNASCDGSITVTTSGGTGTITYSLDGGAFQASNVFTGICAGNHNIQTQDDNGCLVGGAAIVTQPAVMAFTPAAVNLLCFQNCIGQITFNATSGGNGVYQYSIDNGATSQAGNNFSNLCAGTYNLLMTDGNGCSTSQSVTITEPTQLSLTMAYTNVTCNGFCNGSATATVNGGSAPYTYNWTPVLGVVTTSNIATNICAGTYGLTVTDANGCSISENGWAITEPVVFVIDAVNTVDLTCNNTCDGQIEIVAIAEVYSINGGANFSPSNTFTGLCAGTYDILVQNLAGCQANSQVTLAMPDPLSLTGGPDTLICIGGTANITAQASGGTAPYTYNWDIPATGQNQTVSPAVNTTYAVTVTDANGCVSPTRFVNVTLRPALQAFAFNNVSICPGDSAQLEASASGGMQPYTFNWVAAPGGATFSGQLQLVHPPVTTTYTLTVADACETPDASATVTITVHPLPTVTFTGDNLSGCLPLTVNFTNTTPVAGSCIWDFGDGSPELSGNCNPSHTYTDEGCFDVILAYTTPEGCKVDTTFVNYVCTSAPPVADFTINPNPTTITNTLIFFNNQSSANSTSFEWSFGDLGSTSTDVNPSYVYPNTNPGTYEVCLTASTAAGCEHSTCQIVVVNDEFLIYVPNAFTPNGDGLNDFFMPIISGYEVESFKMYIFNRWGEMIFETAFPNVGWDGTYKNYPPKQDVYVWRIEVKDAVSGEKKQFHGHVTLLPETDGN